MLLIENIEGNSSSKLAQDYLDQPHTVWDRVPKEDAANFESDTFL